MSDHLEEFAEFFEYATDIGETLRLVRRGRRASCAGPAIPETARKGMPAPGGGGNARPRAAG